jgi:putative hydrolase of the HAD superfamily
MGIGPSGRMVIVMRPLMLFDLDGTLVDHDAAELAAISGWIRDADFPANVDGVPSERVWRSVSEAVFPDYFSGRTTFVEQRRTRIRRFLPLMGVDVADMNDQDLDAQFHEYRHRYESAWRPFPDAVASLTSLASTYRVAVLTNGDQAQQDDKMERTGLNDLVETTIASSTLGVAKPDPAAFHTAVAFLGATPSTTVYVGDRLDIDAQAASAAGLTGIWLNRTADGQAPLAIRTITTLAQLP